MKGQEEVKQLAEDDDGIFKKVKMVKNKLAIYYRTASNVFPN